MKETKEELRQRIGEEAYQVTQNAATERAFTGKYDEFFEDGIYVDCTLGGAGHSSQIVKRLSKNGRLIGIDQDRDALRAAGERLQNFSNVTFLISIQ